jgi:hypothetical protein
MKTILLLGLLTWHGCLIAQTPEVEITTKNNSGREKTIGALLKEVLSEHDLSKLTFTRKIIIEQAVIPHSHPVLTIGTSSNDKEYILSTYIHEQLHWYVEKYPDAGKNAIDEFKKRYPNVPYQNRAGAQDEYSTYLHLIVCYLEYRSMSGLIGEEKAKQFIWNQNHYTWVYNKIIEDATYIGGVLKKNGFDLVE